MLCNLFFIYQQGSKMAAQIKRLQPKDKQAKQQDLLELQSMFERFPELNERKASAVLWEIKRKNKLNDPNTWTFIMINAEQNSDVVDWLATNSKRPLNAVKLWSVLFKYVHRETGQIMLSRQELADQINIKPCTISTLMSELESIKAIIKQKEGRGVTYYMNPNVGTHLPQEDRDKARGKAPPLTVISGGKESCSS